MRQVHVDALPLPPDSLTTGLEVIDLETANVRQLDNKLKGSPNRRTVQFLNDGQVAVVAWPSVVVHQTGRLVTTQQNRSESLIPNDPDLIPADTSGSVSPDGSLVAIAGRSTVHLFDMTTGREVGKLPEITGYFGADRINWSENGNVIWFRWTFSQYAFAVA
jgi:hypothetical protein